MEAFFKELQRRKVYRVAVGYAVAAWAVIQVSATVLPAWELPAWVLRIIILIVLAGFPLALVLAWAFDLTPGGIETTPAAPAPGPSASMRRRNNVWILGAIGLVASGLAGFFLLPKAVARKVDKSIAVLPFANLSEEKENAYFADGIQDDILTNLSKIGDLKVISRTSVMGYRGKENNVREIGKALGVSTILEGSVRKSGNRVRLNVQLINAVNDEHIWAEDYDRDLTDVFAIQTDLAQKIAHELQAKLSPIEKAQMTRKPTENGEAYLAFVQAHNLHTSHEDLDKLKQAEQLYARAVELDPKFALALARYSYLESWIFHSFERTPVRREKARTLAERALQLEPDLAEGHLALGFSYYYGDNNYDAAAKEFAIAQRGLPNDAETYLALGAIQRRQGNWEESTANLEKASSLNPKDTWPLQNLALNYQMLRDFDSANKTIDRALQIDPKGFGLWAIKVQLALAERGDFSVSEKALGIVDTFPKTPDMQTNISAGRISIFLFKRKFEDALREAQSISDSVAGVFPGALCGKYTNIGLAKKALHDEAGAREVFLKAKGFAEAELKQAPDDASAHARLAESLAWLGEKDGALAEIKRAAELLPESKDAFGGPEITESAAEVHAIVGDTAGAVEILDGLLSRPSTVTVPVLKINPIFDSIREDSRFQSLLQKHGAKA